MIAGTRIKKKRLMPGGVNVTSFVAVLLRSHRTIDPPHNRQRTAPTNPGRTTPPSATLARSSTGRFLHGAIVSAFNSADWADL